MKEPNLFQDMMDAQWFKDKLRASDTYAQNVYASLCNMQYQKQQVWPVLADKLWSCSWRYAGGIVAQLRAQNEDYMDYYCSGMGGLSSYDPDEGRKEGYVPEGTVTEEIKKDLNKLGWVPVPYNDD